MRNCYTEVIEGVGCSSSTHTDSPDRKVGAVSFQELLRGNQATSGVGARLTNFFTLTGLRNNT